MYNRKSVGPRMEPWGTPPLTGYSCKDFSPGITWSLLVLRDDEIRQNTKPGCVQIDRWTINCMPVSI